MVVQEGNDVGFGGDTGARPSVVTARAAAALANAAAARRSDVVLRAWMNAAPNVSPAPVTSTTSIATPATSNVSSSGCDAAPVCAERDDHDLGGTAEQSTDHRLAGTTGAVALEPDPVEQHDVGLCDQGIVTGCTFATSRSSTMRAPPVRMVCITVAAVWSCDAGAQVADGGVDVSGRPQRGDRGIVQVDGGQPQRRCHHRVLAIGQDDDVARIGQFRVPITRPMSMP